MPLILEGIVTSLGADGRLNVSAMGPIVDEAMTSLVLRPFPTSVTFANLRAQRRGVFHVVDDVLLLVSAALDLLPTEPNTFSATVIDGRVLNDACRWYEFEVDRIDDSVPRTEFHSRVVHTGRLRDFFGFNRAKHAVIEAAILASRLHLLSAAEVLAQLATLESTVLKTASPLDLKAFDLVRGFIRSWLAASLEAGENT